MQERTVLPKPNLLSKIKPKKTELIITSSIIIIGVFLVGWFDDGEPIWLMNLDNIQHSIAYPYSNDNQPLQFDFIKMDSLVLEGSIGKLTYEISNTSDNRKSYSVVTEIIDSGDYNTQIKNGDILNKKQTELRSIAANARDRYDVEIKADCNGCRNSIGVKITLYDQEWNEIQTQQLRLNILTPYIYRVFN